MTVAIVTDSAAAIPAELVDRYAITVVPMWLVANGVAVRAGEGALGALRCDARVTTAATTPAACRAAIPPALAAARRTSWC